MAILHAYGLPHNIERYALGITDSLQKAVSGVPELGLKPECLFVQYYHSIFSRNPGDDVRMELTSLHARPERTQEVLQKVVDAVRDAFISSILICVPQCKYFEVTLQSQGENSKFVFAVWEKDLSPQAKLVGEDPQNDEFDPVVV